MNPVGSASIIPRSWAGPASVQTFRFIASAFVAVASILRAGGRWESDPQRPLKARRLRISDINFVHRRTLRKALGGTIVGNSFEWYEVDVFGCLITTMCSCPWSTGRYQANWGLVAVVVLALGAAVFAVSQLW